MKKLLLLATLPLFVACQEKGNKNETNSQATNNTAQIVEETSTEENPLNISPISHATMVMQWGDTIIYTDPVGGAEAFAGQPEAQLILVTDIHGDHLNVETLEAVQGGATIIAPKAVADELPEAMKASVMVLNNGEETTVMGFTVAAIPMYNLPESPDSRHTKGRGNGYVISKDGMRVYVSGDTEDIPEMRNLKDIDVAFVCMNLPYTMDVDAAADAVIEFAPKTVYPYHYRGKGGLSDVDKFKNLVEGAEVNTEVRLLDWYPNRS
ncbi:MBL fold metallo-hydrolase [Altibacter sp. HG106]|uniref:MBL fold metallo-hydrolase n=1 Tax=Altibacter sp. HG106 TaxID=3023937 RepID=UPI002350743C|nr:MBL fold metallo-hydrolase [Altibacter sp. HG106]MDC7995527.1 MBL fold metallo-hydrolase [Altibacter sp. HG106]